MVDLKLEIVSNGVIKSVKDTNYNGAGEVREIRTVYETENDKNNSYDNTMRLFYDISDDLGIDMGNKFDRNVLEFKIGWGTHFEPNLKEIKRLIKETRNGIKYLQDLEKNIKFENEIQQTIDDQSDKKDETPF